MTSVLLMQSSVAWEYEGEWSDDKPTGVHINIRHSFLHTNKFIVGVGQGFTSFGQGYESGTVNLTNVATDELFSFSYEVISYSSYVEFVWATIVWDLPEGEYALEVYNVNSETGEAYDLNWRILNAGFFRDITDQDADAQSGEEFTPVYFGGLITFVCVVIAIVLLVKKGGKPSYSQESKSYSSIWKEVI